MSVSVQELLNDAKKLSSRLKKFEGSSDTLLARSQALDKTVDSMKEVSILFIISNYY